MSGVNKSVLSLGNAKSNRLIKMINNIRRIFSRKLILSFGSAAFLFFTIKGLVWLLVFYFGVDYLFRFFIHTD